MSAHDYMRPVDVHAFQCAAKFYKVWILVRASNPEARKFIGIPGYVPKRLDCKAKTADRDVTVPGVPGKAQTAGLVVDPLLDDMAMREAFADSADHARAVGYWRMFESHCYIPKPGEKLLWYPGGKFYSVQRDRTHPHYGCVMFSSSSNAAAGSYIHSDYDLYGIVRADDPEANVRVKETRLGQPHNRGRELFDIQHFLNKRMGVAMILHGEQEKFSDDMDDELDVFWPDGEKVTTEKGATAIHRLYRTTFKGRRLYGRDGDPRPLFGLWETV
jgi:hypothetical protein